MDLAGGCDRHVDAGRLIHPDAVDGDVPWGGNRHRPARMGRRIAGGTLARQRPSDACLPPLGALGDGLGRIPPSPPPSAWAASWARWRHACLAVRCLCRGRSREPAPCEPRWPSEVPTPNQRGSFLEEDHGRMRGSAELLQFQWEIEALISMLNLTNSEDLTKMPKILSKSAFATQLGVSRSRVSQWLAQNKLHGAALVGTGPRARIRVDIAVEQLKRSLDLSQRLGANGRSRLDVKNEPGSPDATSDGTVEERIKVERLQQLALANEKAREERAARGGRYVLVDDVKQQMGRISSQMLNSFEGWQGEVASIIAGKFNLPHREVSHLTRSEFRTFRSRASEALRQQMQEIAEFIEDDLPESEPSGDDAGS
jgi:hypothetical protein